MAALVPDERQGVMHPKNFTLHGEKCSRLTSRASNDCAHLTVMKPAAGVLSLDQKLCANQKSIFRLYLLFFYILHFCSDGVKFEI